MPRHRRLNIPGAINHVITRGLNRQDIFLDDCDRNDFLGRLEKNLSLTGLQVLLIRTSNRPPWGSDAESMCVLASLTGTGGPGSVFWFVAGEGSGRIGVKYFPILPKKYFLN